MAKHYVTFGTVHIHKVNDKTIDCNQVARYEAVTSTQGRDKAFELFGTKFCMEYHDKEWREDHMVFFPGGYVDID